LGQISLLKTKINKNQLDPKELIEKLDKIDNTSNRIVKIIKGLRSFSRNADNDPFVAVKLQNIFENIFELCREKFKNNQISITIEGDQSLSINARQTQIEQVFTNLINNSFDAIVESKDPWVKIFINEDQSSISIKFRDSGLGIPPEIYTKMMQPFFTTKEVGKGTGLGLSISKGIIEDHQGKLFYNQDSLNTEFVIQFPKIK
jgi:C4-dicarboxylate-specific signal transduction histidine kinase